MNPELPTPLETTAPPPARRFTRLALGLALGLFVILVTLTAVVITSPAANRRPANVAAPKEVQPADATAFLNRPPSRREDPATPDPQLSALLRNAREQPTAPSGPFALGVPEPPPPSSALAAVPADLPGDGEPPLGAYRPYASPSARLATPAPASVKASWQAAFASSLVASSSSQPSGPLPTPPPFIPPPTPESVSAGHPPAGAPSRPRPTAPAPRAVGPRSVPAGTILDAILLTAISTQTPGDAFAHISTDVRSQDGTIIIPRGARLIGTYDNQVALGDRRIAVAWNRLLLPGGRATELPGLPTASPDGAAGLPGDVNNHSVLVFGRAALLSLIGAGAQLGQPRQSRVGATLSDREVLSGSVSQQLTTAASQLLNRAVDVTPTIFVPAGSRVTVLVPQDLDLR